MTCRKGKGGDGIKKFEKHWFRAGVCNRRPAGHNSARQVIYCGPCQHSDFFPPCMKILMYMKKINFSCGPATELDV